MHAPRSTAIGLALVLCSIPLDALARMTATAPNGLTLLAVLAIVGGFLVIVVGNERARRDRRRVWPTRMRRGPYRLESVGNVYVFGDDRAHRAVPVENGDDLIVLRRFLEADIDYMILGDQDVIRRYLERVYSGVTA